MNDTIIGFQTIDLAKVNLAAVASTYLQGVYDILVSATKSAKNYIIKTSAGTFIISNTDIVYDGTNRQFKITLPVTVDNSNNGKQIVITVDYNDNYTIATKTISGGESYVLPIASSETLGGVKVGSGLSINSETGVLSAPGYNLPTAGADTLGGVKVGSGLSIDASGVLSATGGGGSSDTVVIDMTDYQLDDSGNNVILTMSQYATLTNTIVNNLNKVLIFKGILRGGPSDRYSIAVLPQNVSESAGMGVLNDYTLTCFESMNSSKTIEFSYDGSDYNVMIRTNFLDIPDEHIYTYSENVESFVLTPSQTTATLSIVGVPGSSYTKFINLKSSSVNFIAVYSDAGATTQTFGHDGFDYSIPVQSVLADKAWMLVSLASNGTGTESKFLINAQYSDNNTIIVSIKAFA